MTAPANRHYVFITHPDQPTYLLWHDQERWTILTLILSEVADRTVEPIIAALRDRFGLYATALRRIGFEWHREQNEIEAVLHMELHSPHTNLPSSFRWGSSESC